jgi:hypothetical protein
MIVANEIYKCKVSSVGLSQRFQLDGLILSLDDRRGHSVGTYFQSYSRVQSCSHCRLLSRRLKGISFRSDAEYIPVL